MASAPPQYPPQCFTVRAKNGRLRELKTPCKVCAAFDPQTTATDQRPPLVDFVAIWDTGATASAVTKKVADSCGLKPITMEWVNTAAGRTLQEVYLVNIVLPTGSAFANIRVTRGELAGADALIGMDIITLGDFSITNQSGITVFSFRMPSQHTVDFVKDPNQRGGHHAPILPRGFQHGARKHR